MTQETSVLAQNRQQLIDLVTQMVQQMAQVMEVEQEALVRRFPAMAHQVSPVVIAPAAIRNFTRSDEYCQAVEAYIDGRLEVNLLVKVLNLLQKIAPGEFME
jgi:hypothetical protein